MTSVNSPACLLARNHFYRGFPSSSEPMKPTFSCQGDSAEHKQKQVTVWITMATPPGLSGIMGTKGLEVDIVLGSSSSSQVSTSKPTNPADRPVK